MRDWRQRPLTFKCLAATARPAVCRHNNIRTVGTNARADKLDNKPIEKVGGNALVSILSQEHTGVDTAIKGALRSSGGEGLRERILLVESGLASAGFLARESIPVQRQRNLTSA